MHGFGYRHPVVFILLLTRNVPQDNVRLPAAEVGTGIVGHNTIDGIDISQVIFGKATEKSLYAYLSIADINQPLVLGSDSHLLISNGVSPPNILAVMLLAKCWLSLRPLAIS